MSSLQVDRIKGLLYGAALGDALGVQTEFTSTEDARAIVGEKLIFLNSTERTRHARLWEEGDWTDDTDHQLLILDLICSNEELSARRFLSSLRHWSYHGFSELGDTRGIGAGNMTDLSLNNPLSNGDQTANFTGLCSMAHPFFVPFRRGASNGSLMRTGVVGLLALHQQKFSSSIPQISSADSVCAVASSEAINGTGNGLIADSVRQATLDISRSTHGDPRCDACCVAFTNCIGRMIIDARSADRSGNAAITEQISPHELVDTMREILTRELDISVSSFEARLAELYRSLESLTPEQCVNVSPEMIPMIQGAWVDCKDEMMAEWATSRAEEYFPSGSDSIETLRLGTEPVGFVYKSFAAAVWALQQDDFETAITAIAREGGDADTNCAIAGALLGCRLGYSQLPHHWLAGLKHQEWFEQKVQTLIDFLLRDK